MIATLQTGAEPADVVFTETAGGATNPARVLAVVPNGSGGTNVYTNTPPPVGVIVRRQTPATRAPAPPALASLACCFGMAP